MLRMNDREVDIAALATLARLDTAEAEMETLRHELPDILSFVRIVQEAVGDEAKAVLGDVYNVLREDGEPHGTGVYTDALLSLAPATKKGYVVVKQVVSRERSKH